MDLRFKLEEAIMDCWHIVDDLKVLSLHVCDYDLDRDKVTNILVGLEQLYQIKFENLFSSFETYVREESETRQHHWRVLKEQYEILLAELDAMRPHIVGDWDKLDDGQMDWINDYPGDAWVGTEEYGEFYGQHPECLPQGMNNP